jgi:hypothetical protein
LALCHGRQEGRISYPQRRAAVAVGVGVPLELGDRLVDSAGVAADRTVDESGRVIEIVDQY